MACSKMTIQMNILYLIRYSLENIFNFGCDQKFKEVADHWCNKLILSFKIDLQYLHKVNFKLCL